MTVCNGKQTYLRLKRFRLEPESKHDPTELPGLLSVHIYV